MTTVNKTAQNWFHETYRRLKRYIKPPSEAEAVTKKLLAHHLGYTKTQHILDAPLSLSATGVRGLQEAMERLCAGEPLAYVLGVVDFHGLLLQVNSNVLVPRRETEELVNWIITRHPTPPKRIIDLCTGSGCIAISLAKAYPTSELHALDISPAVLAVARANAISCGVNLHFHQGDLLKEPMPDGPWDIIVSNPPYVCSQERATMSLTVVNHEPHNAIFVPDDHPMLFYERIGKLAQKSLAAQGRLYMEINAAYGPQVAETMTKQGFQKATIYPDMQGRDRWVVVRPLISQTKKQTKK